MADEDLPQYDSDSDKVRMDGVCRDGIREFGFATIY